MKYKVKLKRVIVQETIVEVDADTIVDAMNAAEKSVKEYSPSSTETNRGWAVASVQEEQ